MAANIDPNSHDSVYRLGNYLYTFKRMLSADGTEAQVMVVTNGGRDFVLKLYYDGLGPDPDVMAELLKVRGSGMLFDIYDYGTCNGRKYELMRYVSGTSLADLDVKGDEKAIIPLVAKMVACIAYCHHHNIIHRDIKPSNFIFADASQSALLLSDFGFAVRCDASGECLADTARTKTFAAPETYVGLGDGKVRVSRKTDYYSLGIIIMYLWLGKKDFESFEKQSEFDLATMKTYGKLPVPKGMSQRLLSLVTTLTKPDPRERPDFDDIVRWVREGCLPGDAPATPKFKVTNTAGESTLVGTTRELLEWAAKNKACAKTESDLCSDSFKAWLAAVDKTALPRVHKALADKGGGKRHYGVLYALDPEVGYGFVLDKKSQNYVASIGALGRYLDRAVDPVYNPHMRQSSKFWTNDEVLGDIFNILGSHLYYFLKSKNLDTWIDWIYYCAEINSNENKNKCGLYNRFTAVYKMIAGMGVTPSFRYDKFCRPLDTAALPTGKPSDAEIRAIKDPSGAYKAWLSVVWFQENPVFDKSQKFAYESKTKDWLEYIAGRCPDDVNVQRYKTARNQVEFTAGRVRDAVGADRRKAVIGMVILAVLLLALAATVVFNWRTLQKNPLEDSEPASGFIAVCVIVVCLLTGLEGRLIGEIIIGMIVAYLLNWLASAALAVITPLLPFILLALALAIALTVAIVHIPRIKASGTAAAPDLANPDFEHLELEPLHYAFHDDGKPFDSSIHDASEAFISNVGKSQPSKPATDGIYGFCVAVAVVLIIIWVLLLI